MSDDQARGALESERERLNAVVQAIQDDGALPGTGHPDAGEEPGAVQDRGDDGEETVAREVDLSLLQQVRSDLDDIDRAIKRLNDGTYGRCEACGQPIGEARLAALPAARYCVDHQEVAESGGPEGLPPAL